MTVAIIDYSNCGLFLMRKLQLETTNYVNGVETLMVGITREWSTRPRETVRLSAKNGPLVTRHWSSE